MIVDRITDLIGDTPLLKLPPSVHGLTHIDVYAKLELRNPFGSVKDRVAWAMAADQLDGLRADGRSLIESSSGNTAKALQAIASMHGIGFRTVTNRIKVQECRDLLLLMGAELHELPGTSDCPDPTDVNDPVAVIEREVTASGGRLHHTSQYTNPANVRAHLRTGEEILADLGGVDYFVGGLGTTGSTRGVGTRLREANAAVQIVGVVADPADYIPGIRTADEMYEVGLYEPSLYTAVHAVTSGAAIDAMLRLVHQAGLLAGPTTGAVLAGAIEHLREVDDSLTERRAAVIIACDRVEGYLSYVQQRRPELFGGTATPGGYVKYRQRGYSPTPAIDLAVDIDVDIAVDKAAAWLADDRPPLVIDTRGHLAFTTGRLPGSVNIVDEAFEAMIEPGSPFSREVSVLLVCPVGKRSRRYAGYLAERGVEVRSLQGGIVAWRDAGLPLERGR